MDAENDNDQPNSSSASASSSSSNNSSSSNLLGHLPMLPFMRSTDDDEQEADGNDNDLNEEPMPLQPPVAVAMTTAAAQPAAAALQQPTLAPISSSSSTSATSTTGANASSSVGREEPMQHHQVSPPLPQAQSTTQQQQTSNIESTLSVSLSSSPATLQQQVTTGPSQPEREEQLTAHINRSDIADTIDASAVIVQPLEAHAEHPPHPRLYPQEAAISVEVDQQQNDIQLDDNDNNDFDVDLNLRNNDALATATSSNRQQTQQSVILDTSASDTAGPSSSRQQQQTPQPPTTLPLLLQQHQHQHQQQQQQQQASPSEEEQETEESKNLPSYDHHYHNPGEFHLHSHLYQPPCVYPYGYRASEHTQNQHSNGAPNTNNNNLFSTTMPSHRNHGSGSAAGGNTTSTKAQIDRLKLLYPNVNENETPLPRCWSTQDKCLSIGLSHNNLRVQFKGANKQSNDAASVRTTHPIPASCGVYYFEVKIVSKGKNGCMGIGLTAQQFRMNRLPGWDRQSYGYHGDDGNSFSASGHRQSYGPTFTTGDIIGCCINFVTNTCFYTKNGVDLGIAFRELPTVLYPTVGLQAPGEEVDGNFGQDPFKFEGIEEMMKKMRSEIKTAIYDFPLSAEQGDTIELLQKMVNSYLVHNGYSKTAEAFTKQKPGLNQKEDIESIRNRQKILKLVMTGKMSQAIDQTMSLYPGLLEDNKNLWFMLKCRQFIEMINGSDVEYCPSSLPSSTITTNKTTNSITTQTSAPNQTSVIQSTKSYQTGNVSNSISNGMASSDATTATAAAATEAAATTLATATEPTPAVVAATTITSSASTTTATTEPTATEINTTRIVATHTTNSSSHTPNTATIDTTTINNAQNSSQINVINTENDLRTQPNLVEHSAISSNDAPVIISNSSNDNDYLNDVEMENSAHTNGNIFSNGNANINDSMDADEEMDVDVAPLVKKYSHGIERILNFGKDLSQMGQQLEKENKMTDEERQMLEDAFSLIAYSNPWASPLGWQLCPTKRETVCRALNSAILQSKKYPKWSPLEYCVAHANELLKVMAQASIGACAFVNIRDVFPKN